MGACRTDIEAFHMGHGLLGDESRQPPAAEQRGAVVKGELNDTEIDVICDDAADAAIDAWGPLGAPSHRPNPHPKGSEAAEIWDRAFMRAYAKENGY